MDGALKLWRWTGDGEHFIEILVAARDRKRALEQVVARVANWDDPQPPWAESDDIDDHLAAVRNDETIETHADAVFSGPVFEQFQEEVDGLSESTDYGSYAISVRIQASDLAELLDRNGKRIVEVRTP